MWEKPWWIWGKNCGSYIEQRRNDGNNSPKQDWFQRATKIHNFFHVIASEKRWLNNISCIFIDGEIVEEPLITKRKVVKHFWNIFSAHKIVTLEDINYGFRCLRWNQILLLRPFFLEYEVWEIVKDSEGNKAPRLDGFNLHFFKI